MKIHAWESTRKKTAFSLRVGISANEAMETDVLVHVINA